MTKELIIDAIIALNETLRILLDVSDNQSAELVMQKILKLADSL